LQLPTNHWPVARKTAALAASKKAIRPHTVRKYYNYAPRAKLPHDDSYYDDPQVKAIWEEAIGQ
jgi:hypothetical protein